MAVHQIARPERVVTATVNEQRHTLPRGENHRPRNRHRLVVVWWSEREREPERSSLPPDVDAAEEQRLVLTTRWFVVVTRSSFVVKSGMAVRVRHQTVSGLAGPVRTSRLIERDATARMDRPSNVWDFRGRAAANRFPLPVLTIVHDAVTLQRPDW